MNLKRKNKTNEGDVSLKINGNLSINNTYSRTYKWEYQPAGLEGIVVDLDGYDA